MSSGAENSGAGRTYLIRIFLVLGAVLILAAVVAWLVIAPFFRHV